MTPQKEFYSINLRLSREDNDELQKLREEGYTIISVFRAGIKELAKKGNQNA